MHKRCAQGLKMKRLLIILTVLPIAVLGQNVEQKAAQLTDYLNRSIGDIDSIKFQRLFFDAFPSSFVDFNAMFGWTTDAETKEIKYGPLYDGHKEVDLFFRLQIVPDETFYKKMIDIWNGGQWNADAINYFQQGLRRKVFNNPTLTFRLLSKLTDQEIERLFVFFFDGPHPQYKVIPKELESMKSYDARIYRLMDNGLSQVLAKGDH